MCLQAGLVLGHRFVEHLPLLGVHCFGLGAEARSLQAGQLEGDLLELGIFELDGLRLDGELLALRTDALEHLFGRCDQCLRRQAANVLGFEGSHIEHARSVPSPLRRGHSDMRQLPCAGLFLR